MTLSDPTVRRRLSAAERRAAIVAAARAAFARYGYHGTSTAEIARAAGCSEPILYRHFASKQALFAAVLEDTAARLRASVDEAIAAGADHPFGALVAAADGLAGDPAFMEMLRLRALAVATLDDPVVRATMQRIAFAFRERTRAAVRRSQETGHIRADIPAEQIAQLWAGLSFLAGFLYALEGRDGVARLRPAPGALLTLLAPPDARGAAS